MPFFLCFFFFDITEYVLTAVVCSIHGQGDKAQLKPGSAQLGDIGVEFLLFVGPFSFIGP